MTALHRFLLVCVFFFAQLAAGAHGVEHGAGDEGPLPSHVCELCLAAHDLGSALPSLVALPPIAPPRGMPEAAPATGRTFLPVPPARQGAPPFA
ncbi:MAG: hypothetical protein JNM32_07840 [Dechloromonas sp.]|nr:hypothetical protein [Dechloromonas sp.]